MRTDRNYEVIEAYIEKIYNYAKNHTYSLDEAEDLSQEILVQLCRSIKTLENPESLEAWIWSVARNVTRSSRRALGNDRSNMFYYGDDAILESIADAEEAPEDDSLERIRKKLTSLSAEYRNILIWFYYDGMSVRDIARNLRIAEGTVKWRLSQGREKIKKEWDDMNDTVLKPIKLHLNISGSGEFGGKIPFPSAYISDELSKNILWHCRNDAKTVEELAVLTGVPAYYIENSLANLIEREAVVKISNRYQTDFVIFEKHFIDASNRKGEEFALQIYKPVVEAIQSLGGDVWRIGAMVIDDFIFGVMNPTFLSSVPELHTRKRYDGYHWLYWGFEENATEKQIFIGSSMNLGSEGTYSYYSVRYHIDPPVFRQRSLLHDYEINVCEKIINGGRSDKSAFDAKEQEWIAGLVERGTVRKTESATGSDFEILIPHVTKEELAALQAKARAALTPIAAQYHALVLQWRDYDISQLPDQHKKSAASRISSHQYPAKNLFALCMEAALANGMIAAPTEKYCEWLQQWK